MNKIADFTVPELNYFLYNNTELQDERDTIIHMLNSLIEAF